MKDQAALGRGADALVRALQTGGVSRVYALSGNQIMPVFDACLDPGLPLIHSRHEAAAVYMAEAQAQLSGEVGVALVTAGAGFGNALGALMAAKASETPLLLLSGDSPRAQDGKGAFQEFDQCAAAAPFVKHTHRLAAPTEAGTAVAEALAIAQEGRPGPVHIALPADCLTGEAEAAVATTRNEEPLAPKGGEIAVLATLLAEAKRPLVLTGPALSPSRAGTLLAALDAELDAPVICTDSPRGLRDPAGGDLAGLFGRADFVLSLGKLVDFTLAFGAAPPFDGSAKWALVEPDADAIPAARAALGERLAAVFPGAAGATAHALLSAGVSAPDRSAWRSEAAKRRAARSPRPPVPEGHIAAYDVADAIRRVAEPLLDPVMICDGGEFGQWSQSGLAGFARVINGPSGAIGAAPAYAIAASLARPDAQVFALMGDGTAGFHLAEFETAVRHGTPFVAVVGSDRLWNAEHQLQIREFGERRTHGCNLAPARYDRAVEAVGGYGAHVTEKGALETAITEAMAAKRPALVQVEISPLAAPAPPARL